MDINLSPERYEPMMTADAYYFYALEPEITEGHIGQRVVIKNCRVVGYFNSTMEAMGYMGDNGHEIGTFSVHDCGKCKSEAVACTPNPDDWKTVDFGDTLDNQLKSFESASLSDGDFQAMFDDSLSV